MAIPKKDYSRDKSKALVVCGVLLLLVCCATILVKQRLPHKSSEVSDAVDAPALPDDVKTDIDQLKEMLAACEDSEFRFGLSYRLGVLYFKNQAFDQALSCFSAVSTEKECRGMIRACALNMLGQTSRLQGDVSGALKAFGNLTDLLKGMDITSSDASSAWVLRLLCSAAISRAELFQLQNDIGQAIKAYTLLAQWLDLHSGNPLCQPYLAISLDRASQMHLQQGNAAKYLEIAGAIPRDCPQYHRGAIIQLESECVRLLVKHFSDVDFVAGSIMAPALLIERLDRFSDKAAIERILDRVDQLCADYQDTYGGWILQYHYAWLLDRAGRRGQALKQFAELSNSTTKPVPTGGPQQERVISAVQGYAQIQQAIMMGEQGEFRKGLQVINAVQCDDEDTHSKRLKESVSSSLETLNREVPSYAQN